MEVAKFQDMLVEAVRVGGLKEKQMCDYIFQPHQADEMDAYVYVAGRNTRERVFKQPMLHNISSSNVQFQSPGVH